MLRHQVVSLQRLSYRHANEHSLFLLAILDSSALFYTRSLQRKTKMLTVASCLKNPQRVQCRCTFVFLCRVLLSVRVVTPLSNAWLQLLVFPFSVAPKPQTMFNKTEVTSASLVIVLHALSADDVANAIQSLAASAGKTALPHRANGKGAIGANDLEIDATPREPFCTFLQAANSW